MTDLSCVEEYALGAPTEVAEPATVVAHLRLLLAAEAASPRPADYIARVQQDGMTAAWRKRMCEWMVHTGKAFELSVETVACAVHYMDVYLSVLSADKIVLQLVSMVAMFVASKFHETRPIVMEEMELLCQNKYPRAEIVAMEKQLLHVLQWKLNPPTPIAFARDLLTFESSPSIHAHLEEATIELLEECSTDYSYLEFPSSVMAAAALEVVCTTQFGCASPLATYAMGALAFPSKLYKECVGRMLTLYAAAPEPELEALPVVASDICKPVRSASPTSIDVHEQSSSPSKSKKRRRSDATDDASPRKKLCVAAA
ncbi:hypothetical protein ACHHYP_15272 [Achlya hypogyna]|uniref:Cyclin-like domain-containing protein n=1 Tax=Achlya hypogyna TaxID=1202772 RepID=A0A1V9YB46_ACHHY|nr:hypothetical protein ACHHYP_15272 [Achlya hypogyna]